MNDAAGNHVSASARQILALRQLNDSLAREMRGWRSATTVLLVRIGGRAEFTDAELTNTAGLVPVVRRDKVPEGAPVGPVILELPEVHRVTNPHISDGTESAEAGAA